MLVLLHTVARARAPRMALGGLLALLLAGPSRSQESTPPPLLEVRATGQTDGHVTLGWSPAGPDEDVVFELQIAPTADFSASETCYVGPDTASFRSGLQRGVHHFRLRQRPAADESGWSVWSEPVAVEIAPYSLRAAWTLFGIGTVLVASIVGFLVANRRREGETA